jgi:putative lipoprotein
VTYRCDDGSSLDVLFSTAADGRNQAMLTLGETTLTLPQVPAASGALYRANDIRLHTKGDEALFEDAKGKVRHCKQGDTPPATATPTKPLISSFIDISGNVSYLQRIALPPDAVLIVRIQDVSRAGAPARILAEQRIELAGRQVPIAFQTTVDRDLIGKLRDLALLFQIFIDKKHGLRLRGLHGFFSFKINEGDASQEWILCPGHPHPKRGCPFRVSTPFLFG